MTTEQSKIRQTALALLAQREHTTWELKHKLVSRDFNEQDINPVLDALIEEGALSHFRFLESYIRLRREKGYGPLRIYQELYARGIAKEVIEDQLDMTDNAWLDEVKAVWQKRFKGHMPRDIKTRSYQMRFLQYRGFTPEQINTIYRSDDPT